MPRRSMIKFATALFGATVLTASPSRASCTQPCADCHVYYVGDYGSCGDQVADSDINQACGTAQNPCITAYYDVPNGSPKCGKCFKMTMIEDGGVEPTACVNNQCPQYEAEVYVKVIDHTAAATFEVSQGAWNVVCPYVCHGSSNCVKDASVCVYGTIPYNWQSGYKPIRYEEVTCGQSSGGGDSGGTTTTTKGTTTTQGSTTTTQGSAGGGSGACQHQKDCSLSQWCSDNSYEEWCRQQNAADPSSCPTPYCTWANRQLKSSRTKCSHNTDCDESSWCEDKKMKQYCRDQDQLQGYCPEPMCVWSTGRNLLRDGNFFRALLGRNGGGQQ